MSRLPTIVLERFVSSISEDDELIVCLQRQNFNLQASTSGMVGLVNFPETYAIDFCNRKNELVWPNRFEILFLSLLCSAICHGDNALLGARLCTYCQHLSIDNLEYNRWTNSHTYWSINPKKPYRRPYKSTIKFWWIESCVDWFFDFEKTSSH